MVVGGGGSNRLFASTTSYLTDTLQMVGGMDMVSQAIILAKRPHIIVATPGRLVDHLENTKGFSLKQVKINKVLHQYL